MKRALLITTLLTLSPMAMAKDDMKRAVKFIEKTAIEKITEKVVKPVEKRLLKKVAALVVVKTKSAPSAALKSLGALVKVIEQAVEPTVVIKTKDTKLKIKLLKFKNLKLDYKNKNQNLNLKFETDLKTTKFGFSMNF